MGSNLKVLLKLLILVLFAACSAPIFAITFEACEKAMAKDPELKPFVVGDEPVFSPEQLKELIQWIDLQTMGKHLAKVRGVPLTNPFSLAAVVTRQSPFDIVAWKYSNPNQEEFLKPYVLQYVEAIMRAAQSHPLLAMDLKKATSLYITIFGIRYFPEVGKSYPALPFHKDTAEVQSVVVLQRPKLLHGGHTVVAWPERDVQLGPDHPTSYLPDLKEPVNVRQWEPQVGVNRLLIFDGARALHGVSPFQLPFYASGPDLYRDVFGMEVVPIFDE